MDREEQEDLRQQLCLYWQSHGATSATLGPDGLPRSWKSDKQRRAYIREAAQGFGATRDRLNARLQAFHGLEL